MGTIIDYEVAGEPLLATGTANVTDMTFRQVRQLSRLLPGLPANGGVQGVADCKVTDGAAGAVSVAAGYVWVAGTTITGLQGQHLYGVPIEGARTLTGIPTPTSATRRDLVVTRVYDEGDAAGPSIVAESRVQYIVNAAETTTAEAAPANSFVHAYVDVTTTGAKTITDRRWTLPVAGAQLINGYQTAASDSSGQGDKLQITVMGDGVTPVRVQGSGHVYTSGAAGSNLHLDIWDGAGGTGTRHDRAFVNSPGPYIVLLKPDAYVPAFSGPKTFYLFVSTSAGTASSFDATAGSKRTLRAVWAPGHYTANP